MRRLRYYASECGSYRSRSETRRSGTLPLGGNHQMTEATLQTRSLVGVDHFLGGGLVQFLVDRRNQLLGFLDLATLDRFANVPQHATQNRLACAIACPIFQTLSQTLLGTLGIRHRINLNRVKRIPIQAGQPTHLPLAGDTCPNLPKCLRGPVSWRIFRRLSRTALAKLFFSRCLHPTIKALRIKTFYEPPHRPLLRGVRQGTWQEKFILSAQALANLP